MQVISDKFRTSGQILIISSECITCAYSQSDIIPLYLYLRTFQNHPKDQTFQRHHFAAVFFLTGAYYSGTIINA